MILNKLLPETIEILNVIKEINKRKKDEDLRGKQSGYVYNTLSIEFNDFSERYPRIFSNVVRDENISTLIQVLYYKDMVKQGKISEKEFSEKLGNKYLSGISQN